MKVLLKSPADASRELAATVLRDHVRGVLLVIGEAAFGPRDRELRDVQIVSATEQERTLLRQAGFRISGLHG